MLVCMTRDFARLYKKADVGEKKLNEAIRERDRTRAQGFQEADWIPVRWKARRLPIYRILPNRTSGRLYVLVFEKRTGGHNGAGKESVH